jgi:hypothetical protein
MVGTISGNLTPNFNKRLSLAMRGERRNQFDRGAASPNGNVRLGTAGKRLYRQCCKARRRRKNLHTAATSHDRHRRSAVYMTQLHRVGFFRAIAGALDCIGAAVVGVAALPTSILRADLAKARAELSKISNPRTSGRPSNRIFIESWSV